MGRGAKGGEAAGLETARLGNYDPPIMIAFFHIGIPSRCEASK